MSTKIDGYKSLLTHITLLALSLTSCKYNKATETEKEIDKILAEWVGKTALFSTSKAICITGTDSLNYIPETGTVLKNTRYSRLLSLESYNTVIDTSKT
jgi:hypothetical protein